MTETTKTYVLSPGFKYFRAGSNKQEPAGARVELTDSQALSFRDAFRPANLVDAEAKVLLSVAQEHIDSQEAKEVEELANRLGSMTVIDLAKEISSINQVDKLEKYEEAELASKNREGVLNALEVRIKQLGGREED